MQFELGPAWEGFCAKGLAIKREDVDFYKLPCKPFQVLGLWNPEVNFRRLPDDVAAAASGGVVDKSQQPSGGRIRFATDSSCVGIRVTNKYRAVNSPHLPRLAENGFDMYIEENGVDTFHRSFLPAIDKFDGYEGIENFDSKKMREITIHMPLLNEVYSIEIVLEKGCTVKEHRPYKHPVPIAFYGSSITHGVGASRPGNAYNNIISRKLDTDILCFGFSGNAKGEPCLAEYISGLNMSAFVLDYDHNAPTVEHLKNTHEQFFKIIRKKQPELPVVFVSRPVAKMSEDMLARRDVIMQTYLNARMSGDKNVYFVDGYALYNGPNRTECTVDCTHPTDMGYYRMAEVIGSVLNEIIN